MFNLINLIIVDITSQILFHYLIKSFYLSVRLKVKSYKKFAIDSKFCSKYYIESRNKSRTFVYHKLVWQSIIVNNLLDDDIREIFC